MNSRDRLEDFIWERKSELDFLSPPKDLWRSIENDLNNKSSNKKPTKKNNYIRVIWGAIIALSITAYVFYNLGNHRSEEKMLLFAEVDEIENYYEYRSSQMMKTVGNDIDILQNPDLEEINEFINDIKVDLESIPKGSEEKALHSLMESYQTKLMIIERVLMYYENTESKNNNEFDI